MANPTNPSIDPLVIELFRLREEIGIPAYLLAEKAGVSHLTLHRWKEGQHGPCLSAFQATLQGLGYQLKIEPIEGVKVTHTPARLGRRAYFNRRKHFDG